LWPHTQKGKENHRNAVGKEQEKKRKEKKESQMKTQEEQDHLDQKFTGTRQP